PEPYLAAAHYAEMGKDTDAMEWAAGNLLSRDWPVDNPRVHEAARERLKALVGTLQTPKRQDEADWAARMTALATRQRQRDLVIQLTWQGEADLDLEVKEPVGTTCSFQQRQTMGGGILLGDNLSDRSSETYTAAEAFSGEYQVIVRRIWGHPLGSKATLKIIQHQGTPKEKVHQETIVFDQTATRKVALMDGRRTSMAQVPPPALTRPRSP